MEDKGNLFITVNGKAGDERLSPQNYDVREVMETLNLGIDLLFGSEKSSRPLVTYELREGSVKHILTTALSFVTLTGQQLDNARQIGSLAEMDPVRAKAIATMQELAKKRNRTYSLGIEDQLAPLILNKETKFEVVNPRRWFENEFYFYGQIVDWGGAARSNIHLLTADYGQITLSSTKAYLSSIEQNMVYKSCSVRAIGKEDARTGEIDLTSLKVLEIKPHNRAFYDKEYLDELSKRATQNWLGTVDNPEAWLNQLRDHAG